MAVSINEYLANVNTSGNHYFLFSKDLALKGHISPYLSTIFDYLK